MIDLAPILIPALSFAAVAALAIVLGNYVALQGRMRRRLPAVIYAAMSLLLGNIVMYRMVNFKF